MKPKKGQIIYIVEASAQYREAHKGPVTVKKVGRLYFYVEHRGSELRFSIVTWIEKPKVYTANWKAYESEEAYKAEQYNKTLKFDIKNRVDTHHTFMGKKFSTEDLEKILEILKGGAGA